MAPAGAGSFDGKGLAYDLEDIHDFAVNIALEAGVLIRKRAIEQSILSRDASSSSSSSSNVQIKTSEVDLVTELDIQVEEEIRKRIVDRWPDHEIIAEESYGKNAGVKAKWERGKVSAFLIFIDHCR